jgi:hypothetical protein
MSSIPAYGGAYERNLIGYEPADNDLARGGGLDAVTISRERAVTGADDHTVGRSVRRIAIRLEDRIMQLASDERESPNEDR